MKGASQDAVPVPANTVQGQRVIFWLFVFLAAATAIGLTMFAYTDEGRPYQTLIWRVMAGDLAIPVVAWFILKAIARRRATL